MQQLDRPLLMKMLMLILRPAIRFCLKHSLRLQDIIECSKLVFVEAATSQLKSSSNKSNTSRISVMTGVHRRDVLRIEKGTLDFTYEKDLVTKVVGQWQSDKRFTTKSGDPRVISFEGEHSDFYELVRSVSKDINPGTIMFELERLQAVEKSKGGLKLIINSVVPTGDPIAGFTILSNDGLDLLDSVENNVLTSSDLPHFHARTEYDNVRPSGIEELKRWFLTEGHKFHSKVRDIVSAHDQDINPDPNFKGKGLKVVFSSFSNISKGKLP